MTFTDLYEKVVFVKQYQKSITELADVFERMEFFTKNSTASGKKLKPYGEGVILGGPIE